MKRWIYIGFLLISLPLLAEVGIMQVTDEDKHTRKEDFYHTFEYFIGATGKQGAKCQATRVAPRWFATAAHCVEDLCKKRCTIRMDLLDTPVSVLAETTHTAKAPQVFVHPGYDSSSWAKDDFALIRLDLNRSSKTYYRRSTSNDPRNLGISEKEFSAWLSRNPRARSQYRHVLSPELPPIAVFDNMNMVLDRNVSVISIFDGKRAIKLDPDPVYYVKDLGYAYTTNFGIRKGMSGSGVMTNTGELIGIISANVWSSVYQGDKKIGQHDFFVFPVFNGSLVSFMQEVMGKDFNRVSQKDAYPYLAKKTRKNFSNVIQLMKKYNVSKRKK